MTIVLGDVGNVGRRSEGRVAACGREVACAHGAIDFADLARLPLDDAE
jgi:hypothetical protein